MTKREKKAVVLLSGGLDSATTLALARNQGFNCAALSFDYGQRHSLELVAANRIARALDVRDHRVATIDLRLFGGSALTDAAIDVPKYPKSYTDDDDRRIPITYVPARNTIFLSFALAFAETIDADDIFIGVNAVDYSGYPDCRPEYISAFQSMANLATRRGVEGSTTTIHTPLISLTKAQIIGTGIALGVDYGLTLSCYDPVVEQTDANESGGEPTWQHCGRCDSCRIRAEGFHLAHVEDPAIT